MKFGKITAALTGASLVLCIAAASPAVNNMAMADGIISHAEQGAEEYPSAALTLTEAFATVKNMTGAVISTNSVTVDKNNFITITVPFTTPVDSVSVGLSGKAADGSGRTVELTAEPFTAIVSDISGTYVYLKNADNTISVQGKVFIKKADPVSVFTLTEASAAITGADGTAVTPDSVTVDRQDSITIIVPYDTAEGNVTVNLTGKVTIDNGLYVRIDDLTAAPVTVRIGNDRGATFTLKNASNTARYRGKVFVKKAAAPDTSQPDTSTSSTESHSSVTPPENVPPESSSAESTSSESAPPTSTPTPAEKEFRPALTDTSLDEETARVLGGITVTDTDGAFEDGVVMNVKPVNTANGFSLDITFAKNGSNIQPNGSVDVKIPVPEDLKGKTVKVYRAENGGRFTDMKARIDGDLAVFTTDHFSQYILTSDDLENVNGEKSDNSANSEISGNSGSSESSAVSDASDSSSESEGSDEPAKDSANGAAAAVIAGIALGVAALAGTAVLIARRKRN